MELSHDMLDRLEKLEKKYAAMGQDMISYLDGLLHADYLTYWDYIHLDTLLSLQTPRTSFPDESIFILYHQITELYFKLTLHALRQITTAEPPALPLLKVQLRRMNSYIGHLVGSFEIMVEGMEKEQFLQFRMSLLPASGFQSAQFRMIEIHSTDLYLLTHQDKRASFSEKSSLEELLANLYWRFGATELATGKKTLTLRQFEEKYGARFLQLAENMKHHNLRQQIRQLPPQDQEDEELLQLMRRYDHLVNVEWALVHFKSAVRYLDNKPTVIEATGGTNWQKYLPPRFQQIIFFPEVWSEEEHNLWGRRPELLSHPG